MTLLIVLTSFASAQTISPPADQPSIDEADRLFSLALSHWTESTSAYVEQLLQKTLTIRQTLLPDTDPRVAQAEDQLARVYYNRGLSTRDIVQFQRAEILFSKAALSAKQKFGPENLTLADYLGDLGASLREQGRYTEATLAVCRSLSIRRSLLSANAPKLSASLNNLGRIASAQGMVREAAELRKDALRLVDGTIGSDDPAKRALDRFCTDGVVS